MGTYTGLFESFAQFLWDSCCLRCCRYRKRYYAIAAMNAIYALNDRILKKKKDILNRHSLATE